MWPNERLFFEVYGQGLQGRAPAAELLDGDFTTRSMISSDPPGHTRLRRLVSKEFTIRRVEALRPRAEQISGELLDRITPRGRADLIAEFALPVGDVPETAVDGFGPPGGVECPGPCELDPFTRGGVSLGATAGLLFSPSIVGPHDLPAFDLAAPATDGTAMNASAADRLAMNVPTADRVAAASDNATADNAPTAGSTKGIAGASSR